jgi:choline dehydrogenase-like flavoprotein
VKFYFIVLSVLLSTGVYAQPEKSLDNISFNLKEVHELIFDLYFPEDAQLSTTEKKKRLEWREALWVYLQTKPEIISLLTLLQPSSNFLPDDIKSAFSDIILHDIAKADKERIRQFQYSLRRHPDNNVRKFAATLRKLYCYLVYSSPLTSKISGYNNQTVNFGEGVCVLPDTKLVNTDNTITHAEGDIDYLIIGSGPAGSLIAHELVQQKPGCKVVLIDSGSFVKPQSIITESSSELMESQNMRTTVSGGIAIRNGQAFGGGTLVNLDLAFSPLLTQIKKQIQSWIDAGFMDWSLIHQSQPDWKNLQDAYTYVVDKIGTRTVSFDEVNDNNKILLTATTTATTYDLNARKPSCNNDKNIKISALDAFIIPALSYGLNIIPDVKVKKIIFDTQNNKPHASGVEIEFKAPLNKDYTINDPNNFGISVGETAYLNAKNIILCAGTLGSAEILLRSKIDNDNIGKGIVIHPSMGMYGRFDQEVDVLTGLSASVYAPAEKAEDGYFFESMSADPTFIALINPGSGKQILDIVRDVKYLGGFGIMLIDSVHQDNKVFIDPNTNTVQVSYTLQENDKERFRNGLIRGLEILFEQGAYEAHIPSCEPLLSSNEQYIPFATKNQVKTAINKLQFIENENFISSAHMQGSNKMGNNADTSVVSHNFKVWNQSTKEEIDNLYVCDSSIFPTSIGANPMQSIYTFAKLFIDRHIANQLVS